MEHAEHSKSSTISGLRIQLTEVQRQLAQALNLSRQESEVQKDGGFVDVDFVKTKPKMRSWRCKKETSKTILHPFHVDFPEGSVTALMGPSGAGKTTLLDFLTGMLDDSVIACGSVSLPDYDAYVPQDDRLHTFYTSKQYMEHYARLSGQKPLFSSSFSKVHKDRQNGECDVDDIFSGEANSSDSNVDARIATILDEVGLTAQKDTVVGGVFKRGLSGGQKRRLSVSLIALSSPLVMFLDEPTSGLDSESALRLMEYLHRYSRTRDSVTGMRRRVILTIHQPSSRIWELIDNVVLLAQGRLMYQGRRKYMEGFFSTFGHPVPLHYNPSDHFIETLSEVPSDTSENGIEFSQDENVTEMWCRCFNSWNKTESTESIRTTRISSYLEMDMAKSMVIRTPPPKGSLRRMGDASNRKIRNAVELTRRSFVSMIRDPIVLGLRIGIYGGISILLGILFFNLADNTDVHSILIGRTALLYFIIAFCSSMSVAAVPFSMIDRAIVKKEVRNHLFHPVFYHLSQAIASIPACLILSAIVTSIVFTMTKLDGAEYVGLILFITFYCADATSMFIAHLAPELISAICISSGVFGLFTMVMGFLVTPSKMSWLLRWAYYIPFMTYRSLMYIQFSDAAFLDDVYVNGSEVLVDTVIYNHTGVMLNGNIILKQFEMDCVNVSHDIIVLVVWAVIAHTISMLFLFWSAYKNRRVFIYSTSCHFTGIRSEPHH